MHTVAQIFGFCSIGCSLIIYSRRKRSQILVCKLIQDLSWAVHYLLLGCYTPVATNLTCGLRESVFCNRQKHKWAASPVWPAFFIVFFWLSAAFTWAGPCSILPAMSSTFSTAGFWMKDPKRIKLLMFPSNTCTLLYNILKAHSLSVYIGIAFTWTAVIVSLALPAVKKKRAERKAAKPGAEAGKGNE